MPVLSDKNVVVTGATGALGRAVVARFLEAGATCYIPAIETAVDTDALSWDERVHVTTDVDLSDDAAARAFYATLPPVWAVANVAGGFAFAPIADTTADLLRQQFSINVVSCVLSCREAVANMRKAGVGGRITNIAARPALHPYMGANMTAYTIAKSGVAGFTAALAEEVKQDGICVNALCPSVIDTPVNRRDMPEADHGTWVKPDTLAACIVSLSTPENHAASGAIIATYGRA